MSVLNSQHLRLYPKKPKQVYLYGTCLVDSLFPDSGIDAIDLLESYDIEVIFPQGQTCCGQPAYSSGYQDQARKVAELQMAQFPLEIPIVILSGSCGGMMRHHYPELLGNTAEVKAFSDRIFELTEFLVNVVNIQLEDVGKQEKIALHTSCAARREMGVHITSRKLIDQLDNVELVIHEHEKECCGFGGTFSVKHGDISAAMVEDKASNIVQTQAVQYVSADWGCMMNINGALEYQGQPIRGSHIATYLLNRTREKAKE